ncbi:MAG: LysM peptidoglycan-binding domain-containing protein [Microbacteriaceae bacterium]
MTDAIQTVAFLQNGMEWQYLDDVNQREDYFILRSDGSITRGEGMGGSANLARLASGISGEGFQDQYSGSSDGTSISSKSIAAVKGYLAKMYNLHNIPDQAAWGWLARATRIDDATASHEDFYDRLVQDVVLNDAGGDPAAAESILKDVMGDQGWNALTAHLDNKDAVSSPTAELIATAASPEELHALDMEDGVADGQSPGGGASAGGDGNYTIQAGDTLGDIAARYGTTVEALAAANGISDPNSISAGATLNIPGASGAGAGAAAGDPAAAGVGAGSGGGIGGDVSAGAAAAGGAGGGGGAAGGEAVPAQPGPGAGGQQVDGNLLKKFIDSDWRLAFNAWVNRFEDAGAASIFLDFLYNNAQRFFAEWEGGIAEQALQGKMPSGSFSEFLSKESAGLIDPLVQTQGTPLFDQQAGGGGQGQQAASAPQTGGQGNVGPTPDPNAVPVPLPPDTAPVSPSLGQTPGINPMLQQFVLGTQ